MPKPLEKQRQDKVKNWLKDHKHDPKHVDAASLDTDEDLVKLLLDAHEVSEQEYRMVTGWQSTS